jgi:hypothetical protein
MDENVSDTQTPQGENPEPVAQETPPPAVPETTSVTESGLQPAEAAQAPVETAEGEAAPPAEPETLGVNGSMAFSVSAEHDAKLNGSMAFAVVAGNDMTSEQSLDITTIVGGNLSIREGAVLIANVGGEVQVENSRVGLLVAQSGATLNNTQVLMTTQQALALGAALGAVFALLSRLLGRRK